MASPRIGPLSGAFRFRTRPVPAGFSLAPDMGDELGARALPAFRSGLDESVLPGLVKRAGTAERLRGCRGSAETIKGALQTAESVDLGGSDPGSGKGCSGPR